MRTFVAIALAHSFASQNPKRSRVSGYDLHKPSGFIPVEGVQYLGLQHRLQEVGQAMKEAPLDPTPMILLNDLYYRVPELQSRAELASAKSHLVITDSLESRAQLNSQNSIRPFICLS